MLDVGVADGVCGLDSSGKVGSAFLPSYVDDVIEVANFAALPVTGETGKIYVTLDDNLTYRWSGSAYVEISKSLALGETSSTAYRGDRGKTAYDHSQTTHAPSSADNTQAAIVAASSKATPVDADTLALIDSQAGSALKELLWSNVKATLKTYFDTLYSGSSGETAESILTKLLTVDGSGSRLDADMVDGVQAERIVYGQDIYGSTAITDANAPTKSGFYRANNSASNTPIAGQYWMITHAQYDANASWQLAKSTTINSYTYYRVWTSSAGWTTWRLLYDSSNVGTNWPTALGAALGTGWTTALAASRYSMGTREFIISPITSGTYTIPVGEYILTFPLQPNSEGRLQIYNNIDGWINVFSFSTGTVGETFEYGMIRADGTNLRVFWIAGTIQVYLIRIG